MCKKCKSEKIDIFAKFEDIQICDDCGSNMEKIAGFAGFELKFNPKTDVWTWDGRRNPYWDAVKAEKSKGNKVKGWNEK